MAEKLIKRGDTWYYRYTDADGVRRMRKGCPDKQATAAMLRTAETEVAQLRSGVIDPRDLAYRDHEVRLIREHLEDYLRSVIAKGDSPKYVREVGYRSGLVLDEAKIKHISGLSLSRVQEAIRVIREREGLNQGTANNYIRSIKGFSRWLWRDGRAREHYLAHLAIANPEVDRRRVRRALPPEESARFIRDAEDGPKVRGMTGPDRAALYLTAIGTGLRVLKELRPLTPESFDLDGDPPTVTAKAAYTKNKKEAVQPIPAWLVERLRPWLAHEAPGKPVFKGMTDHVAKMLRHDLEAVGIPYETSEGVVDFHALRTAYITYLVASGASVKTCQTLARHSSPTLTIGIYAKASLHDVKGAVEDLPNLTHPAPDREPATLAATGTDSTHAYTLAPSCIHPGGSQVRFGAAQCVMTGSDEQGAMEGESLENKAPDGSVRLSAARGVEGNAARGVEGDSPLPEGPRRTRRPPCRCGGRRRGEAPRRSRDWPGPARRGRHPAIAPSRRRPPRGIGAPGSRRSPARRVPRAGVRPVRPPGNRGAPRARGGRRNCPARPSPRRKDPGRNRGDDRRWRRSATGSGGPTGSASG
jgi:integrase